MCLVVVEYLGDVVDAWSSGNLEVTSVVSLLAPDDRRDTFFNKFSRTGFKLYDLYVYFVNLEIELTMYRNFCTADLCFECSRLSFSRVS